MANPFLPTAWYRRVLLGQLDTSSTSTLVEIDQDTGEILRFIGQVGFTVNGMAWDPTTGRLYASTSTEDPTYNGLI